VDIAVALEIAGVFYFYPDWQHTISFENIWLEYGRDCLEILNFQWPECEGSLAGLYFWGAVLDPENHSLIGDYDCVSWSYH